MEKEDGVMKATRFIQDVEFADHRAAVLKALAHPIRLRVVAYLAERGEQTVGVMSEDLHLTQSRVSQQLTTLRLNGLVQLRKAEGFHYYSLAVPEIEEMLVCLSRNCTKASLAPGGAR
jgi:ArsR family transcriptional regulator